MNNLYDYPDHMMDANCYHTQSRYIYNDARSWGKSEISQWYAHLYQEQQSVELRSMLEQYWQEFNKRSFVQPAKAPEYKPIGPEEFL